MGVFLTRLALLMPAFSLLFAPPLFTERLHRGENAPLPSLENQEAIASVADLSPVTFSVQTHSTSELLRYL